VTANLGLLAKRTGLDSFLGEQMSNGQSGEESEEPLIHHWCGARQVTTRDLERSQAYQGPTSYYAIRFHNVVSQVVEGWDGVGVAK